MRLLDRVRAAISSMRAPESPFSANSSEAISMMSWRVTSGSWVRTGASFRFALETAPVLVAMPVPAIGPQRGR